MEIEIVIEVGVCTDIGKRERNEDAYYDCLQCQNAQGIPTCRVRERGYLFAVADGEGKRPAEQKPARSPLIPSTTSTSFCARSHNSPEKLCPEFKLK